MEESKTFILWFLQELPSFLLASPISQFIGFAFLAVVIDLFKRIIHITE